MESNQITKEMERTYDRYFTSNGYRMRYPRPNAATLDYLLENGAREAESILDFGCGNGRYSLALLSRSRARLVAYDISASSLHEFKSQLADTPHANRVAFVHADLVALGQPAPYDMILMLFGVLSHIGDRAARVRTLSTLRGLVRDNGRLVLSVPSIFRRRPMELVKWALTRRLGTPRPPQDEPGNIYFTRVVRGHALTFFYHLYGLEDLYAELAAAGFAIRHCEAESFFPEWCVTRSNVLRRVDAWLSARTPPALGYGIRVLAVPI